MRGPFDEVPMISRAILRIERADGQHREFDAEWPLAMAMTVRRPFDPDFPPGLDLEPFVIAAPVQPVWSVSFRAGIKPGRRMVVRTERAESAHAKLSAVRDAVRHVLDREAGTAALGALVSELLTILDRP